MDKSERSQCMVTTLLGKASQRSILEVSRISKRRSRGRLLPEGYSICGEGSKEKKTIGLVWGKKYVEGASDASADSLGR